MATKVDFASRRKAAEDAGLIGSGDYLKLQNGDNRLRLLSECIPHQATFQGRKNFKWLCYVVDRRDGKVKPFFMAHTIYKQIESLQTNDEYGFESVPMPYDLTVNVMNAGTKEARYTVIPARKETAVTALEFQQLAAAKPLEDLHRALIEKQTSGQHAGPGDEPPPPDDDESVPF